MAPGLHPWLLGQEELQEVAGPEVRTSTYRLIKD